MSNVSHRQPLYSQLIDTLREKIENEFDPGEVLPSERSLAQMYGVSRTTVRLALNDLERMGAIERRHGKGTYVAQSAPSDLTGAYSFTEQMRAEGKVPTTKILEFIKRDANKYLAQHMGLRIGDKILEIKRLRIADDVPMMVEVTYLPAVHFIALTKQHLEDKSMYRVFEEDYHRVVRYAEEEFCASNARRDDALLLGIAEGDAVLTLTRTTYDVSNVIIEFTRSVARADQFHYQIVHVRN